MKYFCNGAYLCIKIDFLNDLCQGKATVTYKKPQQKKKEESERLRGERDQIKVIS